MKIFSGINVLLVSASLALAGNAFAEEVCDNEPFSLFTDSANGWTLLADNDGDTNPGSGGQDFDAEYLFYKYDETNNNLSLGLQTGFDIVDGWVKPDAHWYFSGDLALSFDGATSGSDGTGYEYAVDFGLKTQTLYNYANVSAGDSNQHTDDAGLYRVTEWNTDVISQHSVANPFAMDGGALKTDLIENVSGSGYTKASSGGNCGGSAKCYSYYRVVTFNLDDIVTQAGDFTVDAHWTMSCGNDYINGSTVLTRNDTAVPEPSILALFSLGTLGLVASGYRRRKMQK